MMQYDKTNVEEIKEVYRSRANSDRYSTSPDFNLRELEIEAISGYLKDNLKILDVGCGNGYSTLSYAVRYNSVFLGIDFLSEMIIVAQEMKGRFNLKGSVNFQVGDATKLDFPNDTYDVVISQRCLLNLPSKELQWTALSEISRVLKPEGFYLMLEGTLQGLNRLNNLRIKLGLSPIEDRSKTNPFSRKFDEDELSERIQCYFSSIEKTQRFGTYFLISRVVHPLLVAPDDPKYDAYINTIAKNICLQSPDFEGLGHVALWVLRK